MNSILPGASPPSPLQSAGFSLRRLRAGARALAGIALVLALQTPAGNVSKQGNVWRIEAARIQVRIEPRNGTFAVRDKQAGKTYRTPSPHPAGPAIPLPELNPAPRLDGVLDDWPETAPKLRIPHTALADARRVDSEADCSAVARIGWDSKALYLAVRVADDRLCFGKPGASEWWQSDSVEFWIGRRQFGLCPTPGEPHCRVYGGAARKNLRGVRSAVKISRHATPGYTVEAAFPWKLLNRRPPVPGESLRLACGVNDADSRPGRRDGQIYFPTTWQHSQPQTFAEFIAADRRGAFPPPHRRAPAFRDIQPLENPLGVRFRMQLQEPRALDLQVRLTVPEGRPELCIRIDTADRKIRLGRWFSALPCLAPDFPRPALVAADYCDGHLYPLDREPAPPAFFNGNRLDMPWLGFFDLEHGYGFALILDTSDDCGIRLRKIPGAGGRSLRVPRIEWWPSFRRFGYPRSYRYCFCASGGYVALAKAYRRYAKERGLLVTLAEKARKNPAVTRLFGAPDVWGNASLEFARHAKALGVDKMLIHGTSPPADMRKINALGYLTSKYDNYTDILPVPPGGRVDHNHGHIPQDVVLRADGKRQTAWLTFDKKTQFMKRCPALWVAVAQRDIPRDLARYPYLGRFIDVTTAEALYECFDPHHPLTRTEKRHCGERLEKLVSDLGLVGGGEHGIWWGVRWMDYIEGMMSGGAGNYSWPAGHLIHPKSKNQRFTSPWGHKLPPYSQYAKFGIGYRYRVPLWELVFHDCIVSTWYWGDSNDWLLDAAPEVTPRKDAFNILYGTIPLLWADPAGSWVRDRALFLRTIRNTCKLHAAVAGREMLSHQFLTSDRSLQKTVFAGGTEVVVNFGPTPRTVRIGDREVILPENGFAVQGPSIRQSLKLVNGAPATTIETKDYRYVERGGRGAALQRTAPGVFHVLVSGSGGPLRLAPESADPKHWTPKHWLLYRLNPAGAPAAWIARADPNGAAPAVPAGTGTTAYELLYGRAADLPDAVLHSLNYRHGILEAVIRNHGYAGARITVSAFLDRPQPQCRIATTTVALPPATASGDFRVHLPAKITPLWAGVRRLWCTVATRPKPTADPCPGDNRAGTTLRIVPPQDFWDGAFTAVVGAPAGPELPGEPLALPITPATLPPGPAGTAPPDPNSLRVFTAARNGAPATLLPSDFVPASGGPANSAPRGILYWRPQPPAPGPARRPSKTFRIFFKRGNSGVRPLLGNHWNPAAQTVTMPAYVLGFHQGVAVSLQPVHQGKPGPDFLRNIVYSSKATGWSREYHSVLLEQTVLHDGPLLCRLRIRKRLRDGTEITRVWTCRPDRIELETQATRQRDAILARFHFAKTGHFFDDKGITAEIDGNGAENRTTYGRNKRPRWFAVNGAGWSMACVALSEYDHLAYWDGEWMGAVGFTGLRSQPPARMAIVVRSAPITRKQAEQIQQRISHPPEVRLAPGPAIESPGRRPPRKRPAKPGRPRPAGAAP